MVQCGINSINSTHSFIILLLAKEDQQFYKNIEREWQTNVEFPLFPLLTHNLYVMSFNDEHRPAAGNSKNKIHAL